jgi:hypothetical protein
MIPAEQQVVAKRKAQMIRRMPRRKHCPQPRNTVAIAENMVRHEGRPRERRRAIGSRPGRLAQRLRGPHMIRVSVGHQNPRNPPRARRDNCRDVLLPIGARVDDADPAAAVLHHPGISAVIGHQARIGRHNPPHTRHHRQ